MAAFKIHSFDFHRALSLELPLPLGPTAPPVVALFQVGEMSLEIQLPNTAVVTAGDVAESLYVVVSGTLTRETAAGQPVVRSAARLAHTRP